MCDDSCNQNQSGGLKVFVYNGLGGDGTFGFVPWCNNNWSWDSSDTSYSVTAATDDKTPTQLNIKNSSTSYIQSLQVSFNNSTGSIFTPLKNTVITIPAIGMAEINLNLPGTSLLFIIALVGGESRSIVTTDINKPGAFCCIKNGNYFTTRDVCDLDLQGMIDNVKGAGYSNVIPILMTYNFSSQTQDSYRYNIPAQLNTLPGLPPNTSPVTNDLLKYIQF